MWRSPPGAWVPPPRAPEQVRADLIAHTRRALDLDPDSQAYVDLHAYIDDLLSELFAEREEI